VFHAEADGVGAHGGIDQFDGGDLELEGRVGGLGVSGGNGYGDPGYGNKRKKGAAGHGSLSQV
jgi:hypothetical protein